MTERVDLAVLDAFCYGQDNVEVNSPNFGFCIVGVDRRECGGEIAADTVSYSVRVLEIGVIECLAVFIEQNKLSMQGR